VTDHGERVATAWSRCPVAGPGSAVRRAYIRAHASRCAHTMRTRLPFITPLRATRSGWTMREYIRTLWRQVTVNLVAKNTATASGVMAGGTSAGTGSRYG
jgi:hypothetical protein